MAYFAQIDDNNIVLTVNKIANEDCLDGDGNESEAVGVAFCKTLWGNDTNWKQSSFNSLGGKHYVNGDYSVESGEDAFRVNYAQPGYIYDSSLDAFKPPLDFPSWKRDSTTLWTEAPVAYPVDSEGDPIPGYYWDEDSYQADNTKGWILKE
jgi:hypothetical protein